MKKTRTFKAIAIAAVAATTFALTGCIGTGPDDSERSTLGVIPTDIKADLNLLLEGLLDSDILIDLIPEFNKVYPNIKISTEVVGYDQMRDKLVASFQSPTPTYDIMVLDNPWYLDFTNAGFLEPLTERIANTPGFDHDDYSEPLRNILEFDGEVYAIPFFNYTMGYIYREDVFDEAGVDVPATLDELVATSKALDTNDRAGIALMPQRGYKIMEEWMNYLYAAGGALYDEAGNANLDSPEAKKALESYISLYNDSAPANSLSWGFDEALRSMASGNSTSMVTYNFIVNDLNQEGGVTGDLAGKFGIAPMPGGKGVLGEWAYSIPANSSNSDAAWAFISWIASKEIDAIRVKAGGSATRTSTLERDDITSTGLDEEYWSTIKHLLSNSAPLTDKPNAEEMIQAVGTELNAAVAGLKSVDDALADANEAITRIQG